MANWKALKAKDDAWKKRFDTWKAQQPESAQIVDCATYVAQNGGSLDMDGWRAQCLANDEIIKALRLKYIQTVEPFWLSGSFVDICPRS